MDKKIIVVDIIMSEEDYYDDSGNVRDERCKKYKNKYLKFYDEDRYIVIVNPIFIDFGYYVGTMEFIDVYGRYYVSVDVGDYDYYERYNMIDHKVKLIKNSGIDMNKIVDVLSSRVLHKVDTINRKGE